MITIYIIIFILSLTRPKIFIAIYLLHYSRYLGFFDSSLIIYSVEIGNTLINFFALSSVLLNKNKLKKYLRFEFNFLLCIPIIGILISMLFYKQSFFLSLIAAKQFYCVFIFGYLIVHRDEFSVNFISKLFIILGIYLSFSVLIYYLFEMYPPLYFSDNNFRVYTPIIISLSCFFIYYNYISQKISLVFFLALNIILISSLFLSNHDSITLSTVVTITGHFLLINKSKILISKLIIKLFVIFSFLFIVLEIKNLDVMTFKESTSITSREKYNEHRWAAIRDAPWIGHGLMHHDSKYVESYISNDYQDNRFMNRFEVVDSGYVDILIKFGYIGLFFILLFWSRLFIKYFLSEKSMLSVVLSLFIFQLFVVNSTWSVFTQQIGLVPLFFVLFSLKKINHTNSKIKTQFAL